MNSLLSKYLFYYPATWLKGEKIYPFLKECRNFQYHSQQNIEKIQLAKFRKIFEWAKGNSSFYKVLYKDISLSDISTLESISQLPCVTKQDLITSSEKMRTFCKEKVEYKTTGGSTGEPVKVAKNVAALARERAATWRCYEWAGIGIGDPQGRFWGVPHNPKSRFLATVTDLIANRKRISAFDLSDEALFKYYGELLKFSPKYLYGYVSAIEALAIFIAKKGLAPIPSVISIITTSEVLYPSVREFIQNTFGVAVFNEYGCGEVGSIAHECEQGKMHIMADNLLVKTINEEIVVTDFYNLEMPLINYRTGDFGNITDKGCLCGRELPVLSDLYGRAYDIIELENGQKIHPESIIYIFEDFKSEFDVISQFQAVQTSKSEIEIYIVPKRNWSSDYTERLCTMFRVNIGENVEYNVNIVVSIARERSGKMRVIKSCVH